MTLQQVVALLKAEIRPAIGCTEPVAVALAAAEARKLLEGTVDSISVKVDSNIFKNGMGVFVPNSRQKGLVFAAALGSVAGNSGLELEVLRDVTCQDEEKALAMVHSGKVDVVYVPDMVGVYVECTAYGENGTVTVIIRDFHTNIVYKSRNGTVVYDKTHCPANLENVMAALEALTLKEIVAIVDALPAESLDFMETVITHNREIGTQGMSYSQGIGAGYLWKRLIDRNVVAEDICNVAKAYVAGAADARMSGRNLAVMSCAGSGNQGLMASLPVIVAAEFWQVDAMRLHRALGISFLVTMYTKLHIGRLSALCGCAIAASLGAGLGMAYLLELDDEAMQGIIKNLAGDLAGVICDGAKPGCSLKLMSAVDAVCQTVLLAQNGVIIESDSGIVAQSAEQTIQNIGRLSKPGMLETDKTILDIMLSRTDTVAAG